jgi:hypothetical protein
MNMRHMVMTSRYIRQSSSSSSSSQPVVATTMSPPQRLLTFDYSAAAQVFREASAADDHNDYILEAIVPRWTVIAADITGMAVNIVPFDDEGGGVHVTHEVSVRNAGDKIILSYTKFSTEPVGGATTTVDEALNKVFVTALETPWLKYVEKQVRGQQPVVVADDD